jgi:hypothetical protein
MPWIKPRSKIVAEKEHEKSLDPSKFMMSQDEERNIAAWSFHNQV